MSVILNRGVLTISIDLELDTERRDLDSQRSLEAVGGQLLELFERYRMPATWAVADPAMSAFTKRILATGEGHEIAILGDRTWIGREAGRTRFCHELARRTNGARAAGLSIMTLLLRDTELEDHLDLAVKQGIRAIGGEACGAKTQRPRRTGIKAIPLRFGLWNFPSELSLPEARGWFALTSRSRTRRALDLAIDRHDVCHVTIDGLATATQGRLALRCIERFVRHAQRQQEQDLLSIRTLADVAEELTGGQQAVSSSSILRSAA